MQNPLSIDIQTISVKDGAVGVLTPDKDGYYNDIPIGVIGMVSPGSNISYETESYLHHLADEHSFFGHSIRAGGVEAELGHPILFGSEEDMVRRVGAIDRNRVCLRYRRVYTKPTRDGKYTIIYGSMKPCGVRKNELIESLEDKYDNTSWSVRTLTKPLGRRPDGVDMRRVLRVVTFDAVPTGGYIECSKRLAPGLEAYGANEEFQVGMDAVMNERVSAFGMEHITHQEVLDIVQGQAVIINNTSVGTYNPVAKCFESKEGTRRSVFHTFFRK